LQGRVRGPVADNDHMRLRRLYSEQLLNEVPAADTMVSREYLFPFACFACRHSFRRPFAPGANERPCPHCGAPAIRLARKFKAPPTSDKEQWEKVRFLVAHGFRFWSVYNRLSRVSEDTQRGPGVREEVRPSGSDESSLDAQITNRAPIGRPSRRDAPPEKVGAPQGAVVTH